MRAQERVRFRNEAVFEEAEPPKDRSRPLEWRRSFNYLNVTVRNPVISSLYGVNDVERIWDDSATGEGSPPDIKPDLKRRLQLSARIDPDDCRDTVLKAKETGKDSGVFELCDVEARIEVSIVSRDARPANSVYAEGSYAGTAFFDDMNEEEERLLIEVSAPIQYLEELVVQLRDGSALDLRVCVALRSFSFEVDDSLREPYHARELFIHKMVPAALISIATVPATERTTSDAGTSRAVATDYPAARNEKDSELAHSESLKRIAVPLWVIAGVLVLQWLGSW